MSFIDTIKNMFGGAKDEMPSGDGSEQGVEGSSSGAPMSEDDAPVIEPENDSGEEKKCCDGCGSSECPGCVK